MLFRTTQEAAVQRGIESHPQFAMVVISQSNKTERLQRFALKFARRRQHFRHAANRARSRVERDFDEIARGKLVRQLQ